MMTRRIAVMRLAIMATLVVSTAGGILAEDAHAQPGKGHGSRHYCEAHNTFILEQRGTATCFAGEGSYAIAIGPNANARANNLRKAEATGAGSEALAENGSSAVATGPHSRARAVDQSFAVASGPTSSADAISDARATARGARSSATASNGSTATANGGCTAEAHFDTTDTCSGP